MPMRPSLRRGNRGNPFDRTARAIRVIALKYPLDLPFNQTSTRARTGSAMPPASRARRTHLEA
jgi:hypothetical protein